MVKKKPVSLAELELMQGNVTLEAVGVLNVAGEAFKRFSNFAQQAKANIANSLNSISVYFKGEKQSVSIVDPNAYIIFAENFQYNTVSKCMLQVPDGFQGNLSQYGKCLNDILKSFNSTFLSDVVAPFDLYIAKILNQPTLLESHNYTHKVKAKDVDKMKKDIAKFITGRKNNQAELGKVYDRMADIKTHGEVLREILAWQEKHDLSVVKKHVSELNAKLDALINIFEDKTVNLNASSKVLKDLSELTFELARQVEFYTVVESLVNAFVWISTVNQQNMKRVSGISKESHEVDLRELAKTVRTNTHYQYLPITQ